MSNSHRSEPGRNPDLDNFSPPNRVCLLIYGSKTLSNSEIRAPCITISISRGRPGAFSFTRDHNSERNVPPKNTASHFCPLISRTVSEIASFQVPPPLRQKAAISALSAFFRKRICNFSSIHQLAVKLFCKRVRHATYVVSHQLITVINLGLLSESATLLEDRTIITRKQGADTSFEILGFRLSFQGQILSPLPKNSHEVADYPASH